MAEILICEDSDFMRERIISVVKSGNHEIIDTAKDGEEAVLKYESKNPELVLMDIIMRPDGVGAIKRIKDIDSKAKIIIVSVLEGSQKEIIAGIRNGAQGYVSKPIKRDVLLGEINRVLNS